MRGLTAIVLAGARGPADPVAAAAGVSLKAFAPVLGAAMLDRVVAALQACPEIARIALVLPAGADMAPAPGAGDAVARGAAIRVPAAATPSASVVAALDALEAPFPALVVTADHALLTPAMIAEFAARAPADADIAFALAGEADYLARFPDSRRTWLRFREGAYSGCNLFLLRGDGARAGLALWRNVEAQRKTPWKLARLLGVGAIAEYLLGRLSLHDAAARTEKRFGFRFAAVILSDPTAAIDVDKPADLILAERLLAERAA